MDESKLFQLAKELEKQDQTRINKEIIDTQIKILAALYDKAIAYTHVIIIGGYAGFFGIWSLSKNYLSGGYVLWSALIMTFSIASFVLFEVYKMYINGRYLLSRNNVVNNIRDISNPKEILEKLQEFDKQNQEMTVRFGRLWNWNVIVAVTTGIIAILILLTGFICGLIKIYT